MMTKSMLRILFFVGGVAAVSAGPTPELAEPLRIIRAVGPQGQGNASASGAWKQLAIGNASALLPILAAMDGANDYTLNWLRTAVDTIASREIKAGHQLPLPDLEKFLQDLGHHPRARRLAFELIAQTDPVRAEQLLKGMLNDPSLEIRRDAVQKLVEQASQALASGHKTTAAEFFQQALNSAREVQQIEGIADQLKGLGHPVDLQKHFGFLTDWKIIGPFDNTENQGFKNGFPPEAKIDLNAEYDGKTGKVRWREYTTTHKYGMVDLNQPYGKLKEVLAYATTDFYSDRAQSVELRLGGKNSWKVWLNGKLLFGRDEYHTSAEIDQYPMPAQLLAGQNVILVKVCQNELVKEWTEEWEFQLRITDALGTPIAAAKPVRTAAAPEASSNNSLKN